MSMTERKKIKIFWCIIIVLIVLSILTFFTRNVGGGDINGKYDEFAACLKEKGAVLYGTFWCPHCKANKNLFGSSQKLLPYVECSTTSLQQTQTCKDKKIEGYPTWEFADGSRIIGEASLSILAEKTSCVLPSDDASTDKAGK
jgi:glutaredoxin